jgi:transcriptional regulator with XRE-family HTH domain
MIETGTVNPTVETLWKISEALGIRLSDLFKRVEEEMDR